MNSRYKLETVWDLKLKEVSEIVDGLGKRIDQEIKETVAALQIHGFITSASCEGHADHGWPYPWVEIYTPEPDGWEHDDEKKRQWTRENTKQKKKIMIFLEKFEGNQEVGLITLRDIGIYGGFWIEARDMEVMKKFTEFLKDEYFSV